MKAVKNRLGLLAVIGLIVPALLLGLLFVPSGFVVDVASAFGGGDGSVGDPYVITNVWELQNMSLDLTAHYVLGNDINASDTVTWNFGSGFIPIGQYSPYFTGSLNGENYSISNLYTNRAGWMGLFGVVQYSTISNVNLVDCTFFVVSYDVGGIGGRLGVDGHIVNCHVSGVIDGRNAGGIVSMIDDGSASVTNCSFSGNLSSTYSAGGITSNNMGIITNCSSTGTIFGGGEVGGLVGTNMGYGAISNCYATGNVTGSSSVGGLVGTNTALMETPTVSDCYSMGSVYSSSSVGGLVGYLDAGSVTNSFYDTTTSGQSDNDGRGTPKTTEQMKNITTYSGAGWDIVELDSYVGEPWYINIDSYPELGWEYTTIEVKSMVNGTVLDNSSLPVDNAVVEIYVDDVLDNTTTTNEDGYFYLEVRFGNSVRLVVLKDDVEIMNESIMLVEGEDLVLGDVESSYEAPTEEPEEDDEAGLGDTISNLLMKILPIIIIVMVFKMIIGTMQSTSMSASGKKKKKE